MVVAKICDVTITVPTSITEIKLIHFNDFVYQLLYIVPSIRNSNFNVQVTFNGNRLGDGHFVGCDSCFVHRGNTLNQSSLAVKTISPFIFSGINLDRIDFSGAGIQKSPTFTDLNLRFHTINLNRVLEKVKRQFLGQFSHYHSWIYNIGIFYLFYS